MNRIRNLSDTKTVMVGFLTGILLWGMLGVSIAVFG
jgi:hypothetical protein